MATTIQVGVLRAQLTADTAKFTAGFREADATVKKFTASSTAAARTNKQASDLMIRGMSESGKAASASGKMIAGMNLAGRQAAASQAAAAQAALGYTGRLKVMGAEALASAKSSGLLNNSIGRLTLGLGGLAIIGTVTGWLTNMAAQALDTAGNLVDLSAKTGLSIKALQQMDAVAEQTGTTLESFSKAAMNLGVRVEAGSKPVKAAVDALNLSLKDLQALKPEEQLRAVADALGKIEDPQKRNEIALRLFGKTYQEIMPAIVEGYGRLADAANVAGDAQVKALDATGDAWSRLMKTASAGVTHFLGTIALAAQGFADANFIDKMKAIMAGPFGFQEMEKRGRDAAQMAIFIAQAQKDANRVTTEGAVAAASYSQQLAKVRAELAALTPEQRKEIAAAQALGVSTDDLEAKYGLTEGALRVLNTTTTQSAKAQTDAGKTVKSLAEGYAIWQKAVQDVTHDLHALTVANTQALNEKAAKQAEQAADQMLQSFNRRTEAERDAAQAGNDIEEQRAEFAIEQAKRNGASWQQVYAMEKALADARLQRVIDQAQLEFEIRTAWIDRTTDHGEKEYQALKAAHDLAIQGMVERHQQGELLKRDELDRTHNVWRRSFDRLKALGAEVPAMIAAGFTEMLLESRSFKQAFVGIWQSIKSELKSIFSDILQSFVKGLLGGMMRQLMGQQGGFASGFSGLFGGGGAGGGGGGIGGQVAQSAASKLLGKIPGIGGLFGGGGTAVASSGLLASSSVPTSLAMTAVPGIGTGSAAGAAGAGGGAGGAGFLANPAFWTNPITIGVAGAALLTWAIVKKGLFRGGAEALHVSPRRDKFLSQFGDPANKDVGGGGWNLASALVKAGAGEGGGPLFRAFQKADTVKDYDKAQADVVAFLGKKGMKLQSFLFGGLVKGFGAIPAMVHGGEGILSMQGMQNVGGSDGLKALNTGQATPSATIVNINVAVQAWDGVDVTRAFRTKLIPEITQAIVLNIGGLGTAVRGAA